MKSAHYIPPSKRTLLLLFGLLLIYACMLHDGHLFEGPAGTHLWTQSDHYALARGFVRNGLDFFHPQTFVYNYRYPEVFDPNHQSLVTAVDFPIHNYIPAIIMALLGSDSPAIMSCYMLILSLTGLVYLFRLAHLFNRSETLSLLIVAFVACTPVWSFYQIRFIPSVPTLSTAIIGLYYGFSYYKIGKFAHFVWGMAFLTLSAMTRMTFLIPLLAFSGHAFLFSLRQPKNRLRKAAVATICFAAVAGYILYNSWLRTTYSSIFLHALMPAKSWKQLLDILAYISQHWKFEYMTRAHYVIVAIAVAALSLLRLRKNEPRPKRLPTRWFLFLLVAGSVAFFLLMVHQFMAHDYYAIDVFFVPGIVLLCVLSERLTPMSERAGQATIVFTLLAIPCMVWQNVVTQDTRIASEKWGLNEMVVRNFKESRQLLERFGVPKDERLVIMDPVPRNVPFYYADRTGYVIMRNDSLHLKAALKLPVRYYLFQNELFLSDIYKVYPGIIGQLETIGTDGKITICRKVAPRATSLFRFLALDERPAVFSAQLIREDVKEWEVKGQRQTGYAGQFAIAAHEEFGPVLKLRNASYFREMRMLYFRGWLTSNTAEDIPHFVVSVVEDGEMIFYKTFPMVEFPPDTDGSRAFQYLVPIPATKGNAVEVSAYIWNNGRIPYMVRDVEAKVF